MIYNVASCLKQMERSLHTILLSSPLNSKLLEGRDQISFTYIINPPQGCILRKIWCEVKWSLVLFLKVYLAVDIYTSRNSEESGMPGITDKLICVLCHVPRSYPNFNLSDRESVIRLLMLMKIRPLMIYQTYCFLIYEQHLKAAHKHPKAIGQSQTAKRPRSY